MRLLVNKQECSKYLSVSLFRKEEEFNRFIREAQMFDLKGLVCESFFQDLTSETPVRDYTLLLEGGSYTFEGKKYEFAGLKAVLSYFAYARYIFVGHQVDTPMGIKVKENQDGETISQTEGVMYAQCTSNKLICYGKIASITLRGIKHYSLNIVVIAGVVIATELINQE